MQTLGVHWKAEAMLLPISKYLWRKTWDVTGSSGECLAPDLQSSARGTPSRGHLSLLLGELLHCYQMHVSVEAAVWQLSQDPALQKVLPSLTLVIAALEKSVSFSFGWFHCISPVL